MFRIVQRKQREGLAAELLASLFCGLPRLASRMAVFMAAGDESDGPTQRGPFIYGGFVGRIKHWIESFAPNWEKLVLNADPPIPNLHMVDIRNPRWREKYGLTPREAALRVDAAATIIGTSELFPLKTEFDGGHFRDVFSESQVVRYGKQPATYQFEPDYIGFLGFAYAAVDCVFQNYPDADKVDFVLERKTTVTHHIIEFRDGLADAFRHTGRTELIPLIGDVIPGGKERVPLQAADVAVWHLRRDACKDADTEDEKRLAWMFNGRPMMVNGMTLEEISLMGNRSKENAIPSPFTPKPRARDGAA